MLFRSTFTATIPGAGGTVDFQDNGASIAGCNAQPVSSSGSATCTTSSLAAGSHAIRAMYSGNGSYSAGIAGPITQTVNVSSAPTAATTPTPSATATSLNVQGLWWRPSESGWGVNVTQQGDIVFATWFTYDASGKGQWLVMPSGARTGDNAYSGTLYRTTGPAFGGAFNPQQVVSTPVGTASFTFSDANTGTFTATVNGATVSKPITRQIFAAAVPTCAVGGTAGATPNYQDLWWRTSGSESGWGMNLTHQGDTIFLTWFTYDTDGQGLWLVATATMVAPGLYSGTLYRTTGPAFNAQSWDPAGVSVTTVGQVTLAFGDSDNGVFTYSVNGVTQSKPVSREVFATPKSVCR